jgi:hypothetical protein
MAEVKTKVNKASVEKFLNGVKDPQKRADVINIAKIMEKVTKQKPEMWGETGTVPSRKAGGVTTPRRGRPKSQQRLMGGRGIVGFGRRMVTYANGKQAEWMTIGFSPRAQNIALYGLKSFQMKEGKLTTKNKENDHLLKLGKYKEGGGCLYINKLSDIDLKEFEKVVKIGYTKMLAC